MMIIEFLKTGRSKKELTTALAVLREFKACESEDEWLNISFDAWVKLEQLQEYLEHLVEGKPLTPGSLKELERRGISLEVEEECKAELPTKKTGRSKIRREGTSTLPGIELRVVRRGAGS